MSTNVISFDQQLPAHLRNIQSGNMELNDAAAEFASVRFPVLSVKNGRFSLKRDGNKTQVMRPKVNPQDPDEPASYIEVVILNIQKSKTYYEDGYTDGAEEKPTCFSSDGITPDSSVAVPQSATCALCPNNAWGSGTNDKGEATKGKACSDVQRLAVATVGDMDDPIMLRVPPASLKNLAELGRTLSNKNVPLNSIVVRISFDSEATGVVLTFKFSAWLTEQEYAKAQSKLNDDLVLAVVGKKGRTLNAGGAAPVQMARPVALPAPVAQPALIDPEVAKKAAAKAKKIAAAKALLAEAEEDEAASPEATAPVAATPKATTSVASSDSFGDELAALLS